MIRSCTGGCFDTPPKSNLPFDWYRNDDLPYYGYFGYQPHHHIDYRATRLRYELYREPSDQYQVIPNKRKEVGCFTHLVRFIKQIF